MKSTSPVPSRLSVPPRCGVPVPGLIACTPLFRLTAVDGDDEDDDGPPQAAARSDSAPNPVTATVILVRATALTPLAGDMVLGGGAANLPGQRSPAVLAGKARPSRSWLSMEQRSEPLTALLAAAWRGLGRSLAATAVCSTAPAGRSPERGRHADPG